tara:strand:+ start:266 stop:370 length:105 start_codon:yes stop_codon:yes gene_type:complete
MEDNTDYLRENLALMDWLSDEEIINEMEKENDKL